MTEVAGLIAAAAPVVVHVSSKIGFWEKLAAVFTAVGGLGAMVGAIAAWRAASASGRAARDATDALAASLKPQVHLAFQQYFGPGPDDVRPVEVRAVVVGPLSPGGLAAVAPATDLSLEFSLASGGHGSTTLAVLEPGGDIYGMLPPYLSLVVGHPNERWPPDGGDRVTATVTYSDVRGAGRYRLSQSWLLHPSGEVGVVSFRDPTEPTETRIRPVGVGAVSGRRQRDRPRPPVRKEKPPETGRRSLGSETSEAAPGAAFDPAGPRAAPECVAKMRA